MAALSNITVLKNDAVTNIVWTGIVPASGTAPAVWKSLTVGSARAHQPELRLASRDAMGGGARMLRGTFVYPQVATDTTTGLTSVVSKISGNFEFMFPNLASNTDIQEASAQFSNLLGHALMKTYLREGFAPT